MQAYTTRSNNDVHSLSLDTVWARARICAVRSACSSGQLSPVFAEEALAASVDEGSGATSTVEALAATVAEGSEASTMMEAWTGAEVPSTAIGSTTDGGEVLTTA